MKMASRSIDLISKKNIWTCSTLFCLSLPLFCTTTMPFCTTKTSNFLFTRYFLEELSYVLTKDFVSSIMFAFIFSLPLIFTWPLAFLIFSPLLWNFHVFSQRNSSTLFSITGSSSFSVTHVSVEIKNNIKINVEKDTTLFFFSLSLKVWAAMPVD